MFEQFFDTEKLSFLHYLGLFVMMIVIFTVLKADFIPKLDLSDMFSSLKPVREGYSNATDSNWSPKQYHQILKKESEQISGTDLTIDAKTPDGPKYKTEYNNTIIWLDSWAKMVLVKAVVEGQIDPKEKDINSPGFDKNMKMIEKINSIHNFTNALEAASKALDES
mgnify:CR=1 FL=1